ncbi:hypothetical protein [Leifsonia xyli]|uniref:hypothetical protein n=1 Tax=Leifsonia xyli TaxID=1575 RepID=UPI003D67CCE6
MIEVELHDDLPADSATLHDLLGATSWDVEQRGSTSILTVRADCGSAVGVAEVIRAIPGVSVGYSLERTPTLEDAYIAIVEKDASEVAA